MEPFLYYLLRASIITALFYGFYKLFFGKNTFHNSNRVLLLSILIISFILPAFHFNLLPETTEPASEMLMFDLSGIESAGQTADLRQNFVIPWIQILSYIWICGLLFAFLRYLTGLSQIIKIINSSQKHETENSITICITDNDISPFSWMGYIVLSRKDYEADINRAIIHHEKSHIQLKHSIDMIITDLFTCLFWFNPFSWLLRREIQSIHEYQADEEVLNSGIDAKQYQILLIRKSVGEQKFALANNFRQRDLHKRITMMIKTKTNNRIKWAYTAFSPVLLIAMIALSVPELNARVVENNPQPNTLTSTENDSEQRVQLNGDGEKQPLYILNEKKISNDEFKELDVDNIYSVSVLKDEYATDVYGEEGKNGVVIIVTKDNAENNKEESDQTTEELMNRPLVIVDDVIKPKSFDINTIDPNDIYRIEVLKGESAIMSYGEDAGNGAIVVNLKKNHLN